MDSILSSQCMQPVTSVSTSELGVWQPLLLVAVRCLLSSGRLFTQLPPTGMKISTRWQTWNHACVHVVLASIFSWYTSDYQVILQEHNKNSIATCLMLAADISSSLREYTW